MWLSDDPILDALITVDRFAHFAEPPGSAEDLGTSVACRFVVLMVWPGPPVTTVDVPLGSVEEWVCVWKHMCFWERSCVGMETRVPRVRVCVGLHTG